jgi:hypothetical protein
MKAKLIGFALHRPGWTFLRLPLLPTHAVLFPQLGDLAVEIDWTEGLRSLRGKT